MATKTKAAPKPATKGGKTLSAASKNLLAKASEVSRDEFCKKVEARLAKLEAEIAELKKTAKTPVQEAAEAGFRTLTNDPSPNEARG